MRTLTSFLGNNTLNHHYQRFNAPLLLFCQFNVDIDDYGHGPGYGFERLHIVSPQNTTALVGAD
jgi:hypothetical protein